MRETKITSLKYNPKKYRETEFDEDGNPKVELVYDELGRPIVVRKKYFWEF